MEHHLTGKETESWEIVYFKVYKSQLPVVEQVLEAAALMLGSDKSRGYCYDLRRFSGGRKCRGECSQIVKEPVRRVQQHKPTAGAARVLEDDGGIRVAHVEAGLRSFDRSMPEEINRLITGTLADYLFVTEQDAIENLLKEGRPRENIYLVGNVMIDSLRHFLPAAQNSRIGEELSLKNGSDWRRFAVLTLHRPSNVDSTAKLTELLHAVGAIAAQVPVVFAVRPRTQQRLIEAGITYHPELRLISPIGYLDFLCLLSKATLVLTDSGGIQEETTALGVPCLTLRTNTERPITISEGTNLLVGTDPASIITAAQDVLAGRGKAGRIPPLWDGHAAERIVEILRRSLLAEIAD